MIRLPFCVSKQRFVVVTAAGERRQFGQVRIENAAVLFRLAGVAVLAFVSVSFAQDGKAAAPARPFRRAICPELGRTPERSV
jgi:hypothetical protein